MEQRTWDRDGCRHERMAGTEEAFVGMELRYCSVPRDENIGYLAGVFTRYN